jgi:hypothetical protein
MIATSMWRGTLSVKRWLRGQRRRVRGGCCVRPIDSVEARAEPEVPQSMAMIVDGGILHDLGVLLVIVPQKGRPTREFQGAAQACSIKQDTRAKVLRRSLRGGSLVWELSRADLVLPTFGKYLRYLVIELVNLIVITPYAGSLTDRSGHVIITRNQRDDLSPVPGWLDGR